MTQKAPAKINAFLKITGKRGNYHEMVSRFIQIPSLFDTITFVKKDCDETFCLNGGFSCTTKQNTIYKAFIALQEAVDDPRIGDFFKTHQVNVQKNIPSFAGLGGGSSDAATFLKMINETLDLKLSNETLAGIGLKVGADVPFFIYGFKVANIEGIGEVVTAFEEELPEFEVKTPENIDANTVAVFQNFRKKFYKHISKEEATRLLHTPTLKALESFTLTQANDLFYAALDLYPNLKEYAKKPWYFSGSGSSFFRVKD